MSPAYCPCHPCICAYRWSCIDLLINTIRNYYVDASHTVVKLAVRIWELMRVSTYNCIQGLTLVLTVSAALIQQTTNSLWHVWLSWVNLHWLLGVKVTLNWVLVVAVLRVVRCMFKLQIIYWGKTPKTFDTNLSVLLWLVCLVWRHM